MDRVIPTAHRFAEAVEEGLIDPHRTIQIGIRGAQNSPEGWDYSDASGMRVVFMDEVTRVGVEAVAQEAIRIAAGNRHICRSTSIALTPAFAPGTGTPEIGGLTSVESLTPLRALRGVPVDGERDVVEVAPPFDPTGGTSLVAATVMYELLCLLAEAIT